MGKVQLIVKTRWKILLLIFILLVSLFIPLLNERQVYASSQTIAYAVTEDTNNNPGFYLCRAPSGEVWSTYDDYYGTTTIDDDGSGYPVNERV
ncbi:hypothetical protein, partial [Desertibacillus haloalkaliphilus]|uniref:hypothetical protein n=1 Tax=Desertibacillus haloalkaliphilus TaxID=1328930 RepID=UPI001C256C11